jgi:pyruvate dehydrogenase E2 component (dihydrolipoamide acetyltransferase)
VPTEVKLPQLGQGMESGTIVRWLKAEGDPVRKAEPLYELDTDKVTQEVEAEVDGVLVSILVPTGDVNVGATIALIESGAAPAGNGDEPAVSDTAPPPAELETPEAPEPDTAPRVASPASVSPTPAAAHADQLRVKASPLARRIARERGIELASVLGTGPDGRVLAEDVERAATGALAPPAAAPSVSAPSRAPAAPPGEVEVVTLTTIRRTIARRLTDAWSAPVFQLGVAADMTEALALRETLVAQTGEGEVNPTINDLLVKLVASALIRHPAVNAHFTGDEIYRHPSAHVGIAVAAPTGLVVPVITAAERRTVREIAAARIDLVTRARAGKLTLPDLEGGTFTISNLGMFGIEQFTAVLNPPQVAILAAGAITDQAVVVDGAIDVAPLLRLTLTCDHRAIDGADGATFLQTLVALIEQPALAL